MDLNSYKYKAQFAQKYGDNFRSWAKQNGYDDNEVNSYVQAQWQPFAKQAAFADMQTKLANKPTQPTQKGNLLTSLLPTGGSIGGAIAGGAAGAAAGSVVPIFGTAVGGLLGAVLGGAGGSALGKVSENAVTGESDLGKGVVNEALMGGATSIPLTAGFKLLRAGGKLATGLGAKTASNLVQEAGMQTIGKGTVGRMLGNTIADNGGRVIDSRGIDAITRLNGAKVAGTATNTAKYSAAGRLKTMGDKALTSQYGTIGKPVARSTNPTQTISQLADMGITNPADAERIASRFTGTDGIVNKAVVQSVDKASGVDTSTLRQVFNDAVANHGLVEKDAASLQKMFDTQMVRLSGGARGSISATANPNDALAMMKALEGRIAQLTGKGGTYRMPTIESTDQANVLKLVRDEIQNKLYDGANANGQLAKVLTPKFRSDLLALHPGNEKWLSHVDNNVMNVKTIGDLRSSMAPFVKIGKIIQEGDTNALTAGGRLGNAFSGNAVVNAVGGMATDLIKNPVARASGRLLRAAGGTGGERAIKPVGQGLMALTGKQVSGRALTGMYGQPTSLDSAMTGLPDPSLDPNADPYGLSSGSPDQTGPSAPPNPFGISIEEVAGQMRNAMANGDTKGYAQLGDLYDRIDAYQTAQAKASGGGTSPYSKPSAAQYSQANSALASIDQLDKMLGGSSDLVNRNAAPGQDIPLVGSLVSGALGTSEYRALTQNVLNSVARINTGANMPASEEAFYNRTYLPQPGDSPDTKATKMATLRQFFVPMLGYSGPDQTGLESALSSFQ